MKPIDDNARNSREQTHIELFADHPGIEANAPELHPWGLQAPIDNQIQPEENAPRDVALEQNNIEVARERQANDHMLLQWRLLTVEICFTAIGVAVQALQTPTPLNASFQFRCFRMAMVFSFAALLMSVYIYRYLESVALILEYIGVVFGAMAFLLAITMD